MHINNIMGECAFPPPSTPYTPANASAAQGLTIVAQIPTPRATGAATSTAGASARPKPTPTPTGPAEGLGPSAAAAGGRLERLRRAGVWAGVVLWGTMWTCG